MKRIISVLFIIVFILLFTFGNYVFATDTTGASLTTSDRIPPSTQTTTTPSTTVSTSSSIQNESLGLTNILNILLIVVGVVLILLGIAVLIRVHS